MPRLPEPNAKTSHIKVLPSNKEEEEILRNFKALMVHDGYHASKVIITLLLKYLKEHNWPPGNPQTLLLDVRHLEQQTKEEVEAKQDLAFILQNLDQLLDQEEPRRSRNLACWRSLAEQYRHLPEARKFLEWLESM